MPPIHSEVASGKARATKPPAKPPINSGGEAYAFDDGGVFIAREAEVDDEWRRHRAGQRVGEFEQHDEGQHDEGEPHR